MHKQIKVEDLLPGMMVTTVLEQSGPMKIRKVGMIRSPDMIKGLKEMGVTLVEVDLEQSLNVEFEDEDIQASSAQIEQSAQATKRPTTATQRLVATDKQIADVDRQLSQQFHRSLFLPAVDQMPSKWTLYGKPYSYLVGFICIGLLLGWVGAAVPGWWLNSTKLSSAQNIDTTQPGKANDIGLNELNSASTSDTANGNLQAPNELPQTKEPSVTQAAEQNNLSAENENSAATGAAQTAAGNAPETLPQEPAPEQASTAQPSQYESVNGVLLEAGQQVLGYRAGAEQETTPSSPESLESQSRQTQKDLEDNPIVSNAPGFTSISKPQVGSVDNDLLRRIQRATQEIDNQPAQAAQPVLKVTDLNKLPRIDQLSPAILTQMPSMSFSAHMYASNPQDRWVRVNGKRIGEGDYITDGLQIKRIEAEKVVLGFRDKEFTMNALTDW